MAAAIDIQSPLASSPSKHDVVFKTRTRLARCLYNSVINTALGENAAAGVQAVRRFATI